MPREKVPGTDVDHLLVTFDAEGSPYRDSSTEHSVKELQDARGARR